jgi:uncharacterized protein (DUF1684 family)
MQHPHRILLPLIIILWSGNLLAQPSAQPSAQPPSAYTQEIESWHQSRIKNLKADNGWLNLAGLFWLNEGKNSFGSDGGNTIVFPQGTIPASAGYFERTGNVVKIVIQNNLDIRVNGAAVKETVIYAGDSSRPPVVSYGSLRWTIIRRDDKIGVRLRNLESPQATTFKDIERFPVDSAWKVQATLHKEQQPQTIAIANVLGQISQQQTPGKLFFTIGDKQYTLDALEEGNELFIIFADATNGKTTYPSGRFLSVKKPGADGLTTIDFNKAYDPPCAFTPYATCPLPPKQNVLDLAITAGEKDYGHH